MKKITTIIFGVFLVFDGSSMFFQNTLESNTSSQHQMSEIQAADADKICQIPRSPKIDDFGAYSDEFFPSTTSSNFDIFDDFSDMDEPPSSNPQSRQRSASQNNARERIGKDENVNYTQENYSTQANRNDRTTRTRGENSNYDQQSEEFDNTKEKPRTKSRRKTDENLKYDQQTNGSNYKNDTTLINRHVKVRRISAIGEQQIQPLSGTPFRINESKSGVIPTLRPFKIMTQEDPDMLPGLFSPGGILSFERDMRAPERPLYSQLVGNSELYLALSNTKAARVVSIDGGGIRGLIPVTIFKTLEELTGNQTMNDMFHFFAGTSTGALLAAGYNIPEPGNPLQMRYNSCNLQDIYLSRGAEIFTRKFGHFWGAGGPKYRSDNAYRVFSELAGDLKLSELSSDVLISWYNVEARKTSFFKSYVARQPLENIASDYYVRDVMAATSAAPTYFKARKIRTINEIQRGIATRTHAADGGLGCNNPVICAFTDANKIYPKAESMFICRFGTGKYTDHSNPYYGIQWLSHITDVLMSSNSEMGMYSLKNNGTIYNKQVIYCDFQIDLPREHSAMDNVDPENMAALMALALENDDISRKLRDIAPALSLPKTQRNELVLQEGESCQSNFTQLL